MPTIIGDFPPYTIFYPKDKVQQEFTRVKVDGGSIQLDHASHNDTFAHLYLKGNLQSHEDYIKVENASGTELLSIDYTGKLHATNGILSPEISSFTSSLSTNTSKITTIEPKVDANEDAIAAHTVTLASHTQDIAANNALRTAATHLPTDGTVVQRLNTGSGTQFTVLTANIINGNQAFAAYGDSSFQWIEQQNGQNVIGSFARLGTNVVEMGDLSEAGNGLELCGLPVPGDQYHNKIELFPQTGAPSIQLQCSKVGGVPWIRLRNEDALSCVEVDRYGVSLAVSTASQNNINPINSLSGTLGRGLTQIMLTLTGAWTANNPELVITLTGYVKNYFVKSIEATLDTNSTSSFVYVDRYAKSIKNPAANSELRIVLKHELLAGEQNIPSGSVIILTILNNSIVT